MNTCEGKVAIVTGAVEKGTGRSIALSLAREGADIWAFVAQPLEMDYA